MEIKPSRRGLHVLMSLPNILTFIRILAVPVLVICFFFDTLAARRVALIVFIAAGITDFFDGYLARLWSQQSALGRMLDPIADKLLVVVCLFMLTAIGTIGGIHLCAAVIILSREILVSGLREFLAELRNVVPVSTVAKWKTAIQLTAIGLLVARPASDTLLVWTSNAGLVGLWCAAILTLYTGYDYLKAGVDHITKKDEE
ncbi:MAG: CDP-diacylglycerol--glycerol-3-phosphate 3-phosphatidyltransferase [Hyphomicrobiales bacterium]